MSTRTVSLLSKEVSQYKWSYKFFRWYAELIEGRTIMPKHLHHTGILVGDIFYDFTAEGLFATPGDKALVQNEYISMESKEVHNSTIKSFESWLTSPDCLQKFSKANYDKVSNNCIIFTKLACEKLGLPFPTELDVFLKWITEMTNAFLVILIGVQSNSSSVPSISSGATKLD